MLGLFSSKSGLLEVTYDVFTDDVLQSGGVQGHRALLFQRALHTRHPVQHLIQAVLHTQRAGQGYLQLLVSFTDRLGQVIISPDNVT